MMNNHHVDMMGILMHVGGSLCIVYGQTMVKVAHCVVETSMSGNTWFLTPSPGDSVGVKYHVPSPRPGLQHQNAMWRRPDGTWKVQRLGSKMISCIGWTLFGLGNVMRFASMRFASQTVLSGLGSLQFVVIPVASKHLLGVQPEISTGIGIAVVLLGNVLILMNGPPEVGFTPLELRHQWSTPEMRRFLFGIGFTMMMLHGLWRWIHHRRRTVEAAQRQARVRLRTRSRESMEDLFPGGSLSLIPGSNEVDVIEDPGDPSTLRMFTAALLFSAVSSFVGAWSVLCSKSLTYIAEAMPYSIYDWYTWVILTAFFISAGFWIRQSNKGLKLYPATLIMPLMQAFWLGMSVLQGMIYFDEMQHVSQRSLVLLMLGLIMAICGAVAMGLSGYFNEHKMAAMQLGVGKQDEFYDAMEMSQTRGAVRGHSLSDVLQEQVSMLSARKTSNVSVNDNLTGV
jgi:hypothetical protein